MKHYDDLKYIDYVIKFTNQIDRTNELMLVCLNIIRVLICSSHSLKSY